MAPERSNPWTALPLAADYVLNDDEPPITAFNQHPTTHADVTVRLELLPEPFLGDPEAPVVLLNLNPGFDAVEDRRWHAFPVFQDLSRANLSHDRSLLYPFFLLDPLLATSGGGKWWRQRLKMLIARCGLEQVARNLFCVEYFPYHSKKFSGKMPLIPSQQYGFSLVQAAIDRGAMIIVLRSAAQWHAAIPALTSYKRYFVIRTPKARAAPYSPMLFPGWIYDRTMRVTAFDEIVAALCHAAT
jgi:hypothetical protein